MTHIDELPTPALVLDLDKVEANVASMAARVERLGVTLRPHIKTHKAIELARLQRAHGAAGLTVSTLYEARVFGDQGFDDLTWAFPLIPSRIDEARQLAERVTLRLVVDSDTAIDLLEAQRFPFHVWLKVDCGYHRAGVDPTSPVAFELAGRLADSTELEFDGLLTHSGHAYKATSRADLERVAAEEHEVMVEFAAVCRQRGVEVPALSVGSTPAMSVVDDLEGIDEARPGNYVFYDFTQVALGACRISDCAATVLTSVVSAQPGADHCVVDAGALVLSKDRGPGSAARQRMGRVFEDYTSARLNPDIFVRTLSQEHAILSAHLPVGTRLRVLPNHSCLTVACFDHCAVVRGDEVVGHWRIWNGRS